VTLRPLLRSAGEADRGQRHRRAADAHASSQLGTSSVLYTIQGAGLAPPALTDKPEQTESAGEQRKARRLRHCRRTARGVRRAGGIRNEGPACRRSGPSPFLSIPAWRGYRFPTSAWA